MKVEVGQEVYIVPIQSKYEQPFLAKITKVGRKWAYIKSYRCDSRFNPNTGYVDSGEYSPRYRVYLNREEHEIAVEREERWSRIRRHIQLNAGCLMKSISDADLTNLETIFGITSDGE